MSNLEKVAHFEVEELEQRLELGIWNPQVEPDPDAGSGPGGQVPPPCEDTDCLPIQ